MGDISYAAVCGIYCGDCEYLSRQCKGCVLQAGKPFWAKLMPSKICPLHDCCRNSKRLEHCGLCEDFPCETFRELRDPSVSDEEFEKSLSQRQGELKKRRELGTEQWLSERTGS